MNASGFPSAFITDVSQSVRLGMEPLWTHNPRP